MNVADRFKPVSQIEVKRAVEPGGEVGRLQVGPIESQIEVVKQVQAASLDELIAHDRRSEDKDGVAASPNLSSEESAARKAKKRFEEEEAKRAEEAREREAQRKREEEAKAKAARKADKAAAQKQRDDAERAVAAAPKEESEREQPQIAGGDQSALLAAKQKALDLAQEWLAEEELKHSKTTAALNESEKQRAAAVAATQHERERREEAEKEARKAAQQLADMGAEMANHVSDLEKEIARLRSEAAAQKAELEKLTHELEIAKKVTGLFRSFLF